MCHTAFCHLLPTSFRSLLNPCLGSFWSHYDAAAGLIAMVSVFMVMSVEQFFAIRGAGHTHGNEYDEVPIKNDGEMHEHDGALESRKAASRGSRNARPAAARRQSSIFTLHPLEGSSRENLVGGASPIAQTEGLNGSAYRQPNRRDTDRNDGLEEEEDEDDMSLDELDPESSYANGHAQEHEDYSTSGTTQQGLQREHQEQQKALLQCLLLEAGILFHSIFIGMALSVATGPAFVVFLVAISFHQTFEGLALGSRIAAITSFGPSSFKPWLMSLAYGCTTPLGQGLGILLHNLYDPESRAGLLMVGIMNAISSGLLLFAGLVELLAEDFLSDKSYEKLRGRSRIEACVAVAAGGLLMAVVGAFA